MGGPKGWRKRRARYRLRTEATIIPARRRAVRDFMAWYRERSPASHYLTVTVMDATKLRHRDDNGTLSEGVYGCFWMPHDPKVSKYGPSIYVAAARRPTVNVLQTLGHELAHYEEWARTGWSTERGKEQRGDALVRRYLSDRRRRADVKR